MATRPHFPSAKRRTPDGFSITCSCGVEYIGTRTGANTAWMAHERSARLAYRSTNRATGPETANKRPVDAGSPDPLHVMARNRGKGA